MLDSNHGRHGTGDTFVAQSAARGMTRTLAQGGPHPEKSGQAETKMFVESRHAEPTGFRATTHSHAPREAATGSTYCKAIVANRKLPLGAMRATGQRLGRQHARPED
jgi:hypothetical protein